MSLAKDLKTSDGMRNKPCVCGSGKKFKRCCWEKHNVSETLTTKAWGFYMKDLRYIGMQNFKKTGEFLTADNLHNIMENNNARPGEAEAMVVTT